MKKIVIVKRSFIDSIEEHVLRECLKIMFPESGIEIRSNPLVSIPDEKIRMNPDQIGSLYKRGKRRSVMIKTDRV